MNDSDNSKLSALRSLDHEILDPERPAYSLRPEVLEMGSIYARQGRFRGPDSEDISRGETRAADGLALSPTMAAMCVDDFARTVAFIRGTYAAIMGVRQQNPDRPARVLYAGCGPYAALALPLMAIFSRAEVEFTLLDIHAESMESVRTIADNLGVIDRIADFATADAASYRVEPDRRPDIILLEMMQAGLEAEPQVTVTGHLLRQAPGAILVPEEIRIDLVLVNSSREFDLSEAGTIDRNRAKDRIPVGPVTIVNGETIVDSQNSDDGRLPATTLQLPDFPVAQYQPMLFTTISVYKNHVLRDYESGLTLPGALRVEGAIRSGNSLRFQYELGQSPKLNAELLE